MATRVIDDTKLQNIAVAIQGKDSGGTMTVDEMPTRIAAIPTQDNTVLNSLIKRTITSIENSEVTSIGGSAFRDCSNLTSVSFPNATRIGDSAFRDCSNLTSVSFPNATRIGDSAFQSCKKLTSVSFPNATRIGGSAFQYCSNLTSVSFPNATSIGGDAFQSCSNLTSVSFPNATSIGSRAFQSCNSLCDVLLESKPTLANINAFSNLPTNYRIYVPRTNLSWFETATNWSTIYTAHIVVIEDYINYLESLGFDVEKYKEVTA